ncbi:MAG: DUF2283 domain-containing protein [Oculatellaceae cyanobacterium Prado106]|jgi:hypothetical protein|nr:DUF2283 domain-containing protein [Oculatellaceae cyanobacterium Prado106]
MNSPTIHYDEISDTLTLTFESGIPATGIELNPHLLLRYNSNQHQLISLSFLEYSLWAQTTEFGTRSFPLSGLSALPLPLQAELLNQLNQSPLSEFLQCSTYTLSSAESIPIVSLKPASIQQSA